MLKALIFFRKTWESTLFVVSWSSAWGRGRTLGRTIFPCEQQIKKLGCAWGSCVRSSTHIMLLQWIHRTVIRPRTWRPFTTFRPSMMMSSTCKRTAGRWRRAWRTRHNELRLEWPVSPHTPQVRCLDTRNGQSVLLLSLWVDSPHLVQRISISLPFRSAWALSFYFVWCTLIWLLPFFLITPVLFWKPRATPTLFCKLMRLLTKIGILLIFV